MQKLNVVYQGWGQHFVLGTLAMSAGVLFFEYSNAAHQAGLELSPVKLKLQTSAYHHFPSYQHGLPGLIADALPDGWGMLLMNRLFRARSLPVPGPLDRLAFVGARGLGALTFEPAEPVGLSAHALQLLQLAEEAQAVLAERETPAGLLELAVLGGSPHGARPKVLVDFDVASGQISQGMATAAEPWLFKFPAQYEHKEVCAIEGIYAHIARAAGLDMPTHCVIELGAELAAFGVRRFDREQNQRVPMLTVAAALDLDFSLPRALDYTALLRLTRFITRDEQQVKVMYQRCVFNVVMHNHDDHTKNFAFRLGADGRYQVAPAYDLTFNHGPGGEHQLDIVGEARHPTRAHLLRLAADNAVPKAFAAACIEQIADAAAQWAPLAAHAPVRASSRKEIATQLEANRSRMR